MAKHPGRSPVGCVQGGSLFLGKCEQKACMAAYSAGEQTLLAFSNLEKGSFPTLILSKGEGRRSICADHCSGTWWPIEDLMTIVNHLTPTVSHTYSAPGQPYEWQPKELWDKDFSEKSKDPKKKGGGTKTRRTDEFGVSAMHS